MNARFLTLTLIAMLIIASCNLPSGAAPTDTPIPLATTPALPTDTPPPTNTPLPTNTALPTLTFTPSVPTVTTRDQPVNCRFGPGVAWEPISALNLGQSAQIVGKNSTNEWWYIQDPLNPGRNCWVAASVTNASGNLSIVQVVSTPSASVTDVSLSLDPRVIDLALLCVGAIPVVKFAGTIETNGPTEVKWNFETQQGGAQPLRTTLFDAFGTKDVSGEYTPVLPFTQGDYYVRLIVTSPNSLIAEATYRIDCT